jgi:exopolysaccharide biosynthesis polyprenyl glycosylphosphotransferase
MHLPTFFPPPGAWLNRLAVSVTRVRLPEAHLRFSERRLFLATGDLFIVNAALFLVLVLRFPTMLSAGVPELWLLWFCLLSALWFAAGSLFNLYDLAQAAQPMRSVWSAGRAALLTGGVYLFIPFVTPPLPDHRIAALLLPLGASLGVAAWRLLYAEVFVQPAFNQRILIVGAGSAGQALMQGVRETLGDADPGRDAAGYRVLGFVDDDPAKQGCQFDGVPVLGSCHDLGRLLEELRPDQMVIAITHHESMTLDLFQGIVDCYESGIPVTSMDTLYEHITGRLAVEHIGRNFHSFTPLEYPATERLYLALRHGMDLLLGLVGCLALLAVIPVVWIANRIASPGPLFYTQERVGQGGRIFRVVKLRSMVTSAEKTTGPVWAQEHDQRITPVGQILRKTRLDELPQVWNILKGEMTFIGPRPERPQFVDQLAAELPFYRLRHAIKPGLTGWAQVRYRYGASVKDSLTKLQYDLYYIKRQGPYLDLQILLKTVQVVLGFKGR